MLNRTGLPNETSNGTRACDIDERARRAFAGLPARRPIALVDLVETKTDEERATFVEHATRIAKEFGGRRVLANEALAPMIIPDASASAADHATGLLVVTRYPSPEAGRRALAARHAAGSDFRDETLRTFAVRPAGPIEALVQRHLPRLRGRLERPSRPDEAQSVDALIEAARILGSAPGSGRYASVWPELLERADARPLYMLNFLTFVERADYGAPASADDEGARAAEVPPPTVSGARVYERYGHGMIGTLGAVGGRIGWSGRSIQQVAGADDGHWDQIVLAVYPSPAAMMTMLSMPRYRSAHVHREAALARTRLLATRPIETL